MDRRFCATATRTRLDRGSQHRDRVPVVGGTHRTRRRDGGRVRPAQGRCHCDALRRTSRRGKAGDIGRSNRLRAGVRSGRRWPGATGGNITGLSIQAPDLAGKRLALLREVVPGLRRLAIMVNVALPAAVLEMGEIQAAAGTLGLDVATFEIRRAEDIAPAFEALKGRAEALYGSRAVSARMLIRTRWMITS